jgi:hypothetical protein
LFRLIYRILEIVSQVYLDRERREHRQDNNIFRTGIEYPVHIFCGRNMGMVTGKTPDEVYAAVNILDVSE